jgi:REP element-mobilizing transposase RayT
MGSFRKILYHIILTPYKREKVLTGENRIRLYKYISTVSNNWGCQIFAINGISDHIHLLVYIRPDISISDYIKKIKVSSSKFIKKEKLFPYFVKWAVGYSIFTCCVSIQEIVKNYILNQEMHHKQKSLYEEINDLLQGNEIYTRSTPP